MTPYRLHGYLGYARKALINVIGIGGVLLAEGLVPKPYDHYVVVGIAVLTAVTHYAAPNAAKPGTAAAVDPVDHTSGELDYDDDAYVPVGASEEDVRGVAGIPRESEIPRVASAPVVSVVTGLDATVDVDAQRLVAAVVELALRAVPPASASAHPALV